MSDHERDTLDNVTAALESCLAHYGPSMPEADRVQREAVVKAARLVLGGFCTVEVRFLRCNNVVESWTLDPLPDLDDMLAEADKIVLGHRVATLGECAGEFQCWVDGEHAYDWDFAAGQFYAVGS